MTKKQKAILLLEICLPLLVSVVAPILQARLQPKESCGCSDAGRKRWVVVAAVIGYAAFVAVTVLFVKLAWRWIL